ncbi:MAG TPA: tripartite tricarboxylate transporter substrate binding protein [Xanthobacteraceae bacterium]|nr:tripartite tricarboxylate transporter substrate binding protein [Xanthobacteraceae bacterium]
MRLPRRRFLQLAGTAIATAAAPRFARALDYPTRPVHLIAGYAPGGVVDITARLIAQPLSEQLGQSFVVENHPGAGNNLATEEVVRALPDGYTLLEANASNSWNTAIYQNLNFDFLRDIAPVASIMRSFNVMVVNPSVPAKTVPEFIAYAKANPGKINMGSAGIGSSPHLYGELFKTMAGVDLVTVHYRGAGPALPDLIGGQIEVMFGSVVSCIGYIRAAKLRALAVTSATRAAILPDLPPIGDAVPGYEGNDWQGIGAPKDTPAEVIGKLNGEVNKALADPGFKARLADLGADAFASSPAEFGQYVADYTAKWAKVIRAAGIKAE